MSPKSLYFFVSIIWIFSEIALARAKRSESSDSSQDKSSLRLLWVTIIFSITLGAVLPALRMGNFLNSEHDWSLAGLILIVIGLVLRWAAILTLWKYFTVDVAIASDHKLYTSGIYKFVRHPSYTGSLLSFLGLGLVFSNWLSLAIIIVPITMAFVYRIGVEEKALLAHFGEQYAQYCATTKRLIPGIY